MDWKEKIIAEKYDGDAKCFDADFADAVEEGRLRTVNWNDVVVEATILPTLYIVNRKWTDVGEKRRDGFNRFGRAEKYDFSVV